MFIVRPFLYNIFGQDKLLSNIFFMNGIEGSEILKIKPAN